MFVQHFKPWALQIFIIISIISSILSLIQIKFQLKFNMSKSASFVWNKMYR